MEQENTLDVLLQVEAKASSLVTDAQQEADRRIRDSEENSRAAYEEHCRAETKAQEISLLKNHENAKKEYNNMLDSFRKELLQINVNREQFRALINEYLDSR